MTRESIAALSGRQLDAAVAERVFGWNGIGQWTGDEPADDHDWVGCPPNAMKDYFAGKRNATFALLPWHSHRDCRGLADMIAAARERGLWPFMQPPHREQDGEWQVGFGTQREYANVIDCDWPTGNGPTLPEAFARALLLTGVAP